MATTGSTRALRGTKRTCHECDVRYYDLGRDPTVCPNCGASLPQASFARPAAPASGYQRSQWGAPKPALVIVAADDEVATVAIEDEPEEKGSDEGTAAADVLLEDETEDDDVSDLLTPDNPATPDE